jgi:hypothetical protein
MTDKKLIPAEKWAGDIELEDKSGVGRYRIVAKGRYFARYSEAVRAAEEDYRGTE